MKFSYKKKLRIHDGWINKVILNGKNDLMATCSTDTTIKILKRDVLLKTIRTHKLTVNAVVFSDVYPLLISVSDDRRALCHDLVTMRIFRSFYGSYSSIRCVDIDGDVVAVGDRSSVILYDLRSSAAIDTYNIGRVVNDVKIINKNTVIGCHSLYIMDGRRSCTALCVNQNEIKEIKRTGDGVAILSRERVVDLKMDDLLNLRYSEVKSETASFTGCQPVNDRFYLTMDDKVVFSDRLENEMVENGKNRVLAAVKERLNGICVDNNEEMVVACGESLHYLYRRDDS